jgi:hypothetical protein
MSQKENAFSCNKAVEEEDDRMCGWAVGVQMWMEWAGDDNIRRGKHGDEPVQGVL